MDTMLHSYKKNT